MIQRVFIRYSNVIQKYFKRDPNVNRHSNAFKKNVLLIDLTRGVSLKRSLRLVWAQSN